MNSKPQEIRVRIAPSPTGALHIGTARTALFNLLFARHHGGQFLIRIEDTDLTRSNKKYEEEILSGLSWLGIISDEPIIRQSERHERYQELIQKLLDNGLAYYDYSTKEELEDARSAMLNQGVNDMAYTRFWRDKPTPKDREPQLIRLKVGDDEVTFNDAIRGKVSWQGKLIGDIAIAKYPHTPLYNFAVVVDDADSNITHVIRGEDHISNTPKQILIAESLGFATPVYAHLPLIFSPDGGKMSKRYATTTSLLEFRDLGYLPEAMVNFLALLGWHPTNDKEIFTWDELINLFSLDRVQKSGAVFNQEKLDWLNTQHLKNMGDLSLLTHLELHLPETWQNNPELIKKIIPLLKDRLKVLSEIGELGNFFFKLPNYEADLLPWKKSTPEAARTNLIKIKDILSNHPEHYRDKITQLAEEEGRGDVFWPLRAALSGLPASPPPLDILDTLGLKESLKRIDLAIQKL